MDDQQWFAEQFAQHRPRLRSVAYRLLGSPTEVDDALQEAWLRAPRAPTRPRSRIPWRG
ncbi:sigma factor [Micromonospora trifolii]|uniref:sigma factor n=1 Tax=Micromonospora trifolii TaxID=2911208 RepID=UPI003CF5CA45